ncbi:hypothetical protein PSQ20_11715 [Curvibacter sp. RS43]|uniref:hypothetical protein n=1 Tax=Curvibacter microcysteis TaxID=3026419 RepID=UPI0023630C7F|nr:hypothetical protein [Curvibacter sp. RS43]MDD0811010.1 hypothetical protein [Curvibacter sp. RS43]
MSPLPPQPPAQAQPPAPAEPDTLAASKAPDWDALLESPASLALLDQWVAQAQAEMAAGSAEPTRPPTSP